MVNKQANKKNFQNLSNSCRRHFNKENEKLIFRYSIIHFAIQKNADDDDE